MMVGLPGSGKTTYAKGVSDACKNAVVHSSDVIRKELYGTEKEQSDPERVFRLLHRRAAIDLRCGKDVIYDATNIKVDDRKRAIQSITSDLPIVEKIAIIMDTDLDVCKENNASRHRHVPDSVYERMILAFSRPSFSEGFDQIISVRQKRADTLPNAILAETKENSAEVEYTGVFFERETLSDLISQNIGEGRLHQVVLHPHVTFQYMPQTIREELFGELVEFRVVGYGNDGLNEGLLVEWLSGSALVKKLFKDVPIPHITISYAEHGSAVNTRYLDFKPITPFVISGIFGGFTNSNEKVEPTLK